MHEEMYDSEMVMKSMKDKMRSILLKYEKGILCNEFMDIYAVSVKTYEIIQLI